MAEFVEGDREAKVGRQRGGEVVVAAAHVLGEERNFGAVWEWADVEPFST